MNSNTLIRHNYTLYYHFENRPYKVGRVLEVVIKQVGTNRFDVYATDGWSLEDWTPCFGIRETIDTFKNLIKKNRGI